MSLTAAASTMFLMRNFLMALSLGTHRAQLGAANRLHVAVALFDMTIVPSFLGHLGSAEAREAFFT